MRLSTAQLRILADLSPLTVYKDDRRTRVFSVEHEGERWVVKQFAHHRLWQRLMWCCGMHPAQREARRARRAPGWGIPVAPIAAIAMHRGSGVLVLPWLGESVFRQLNRNRLVEPRARRELAAKLARLTARVVNVGLVHDDFKASNILLDAEGELWLIDTDRMRIGGDHRSIVAMLATLDETVRRARATRTERMRFLRTLTEDGAWPDRRTLAREIIDAQSKG